MMCRITTGQGNYPTNSLREVLVRAITPMQVSQRSSYRKLFPACVGIAFKGNTFGVEEAATTLATNFAGTRAVCERVLPLMPKQSRIVNVCRWASSYGTGRSGASTVKAHCRAATTRN